MATKLQQLVEELKELKKYYALETYEDKNFGQIADPGELVMSNDIEALITKYTETIPIIPEDGKFYGDLPKFENTINMGDLMSGNPSITKIPEFENTDNLIEMNGGLITPTYKPGDSVRVIDNTGGHGFIIGSTVTLIHKSFTGVIEDWAVLGDWKGTPTQFILTENEEFEPIN